MIVKTIERLKVIICYDSGENSLRFIIFGKTPVSLNKKEDILKAKIGDPPKADHSGVRRIIDCDMDDIFSAMEEYAREVSLDFEKWRRQYGYRLNSHSKHKTPEALFEVYKSLKSAERAGLIPSQEYQ